VRCARLPVAEDRSAPESRRIELAIAVAPATSSRPAPDPVVLLAGGPGQAARELAPLADGAFRELRRRRDLVLVDLRGTGGSAPLDCPSVASLVTADPELLRAAAGDCLDELGAVDVRLYTHDHSVADLADALDAIGYHRVNLWGGSFGTRAALIFAARYPERVRSVVLDAPAPFALRYPLHVAADTERVLRATLERCRRDASCAAAYPDFEARLDTLLERLEAPIEVEVEDPVTGRRVPRRVDRALVLAVVRGALYVPGHAALLPSVVERASAGDFAPLLALADETAGWSTETMSLGATLAILCSEELPRIDPSAVGAATAGTTLGRSFFDAWAGLCADWPRGPVPGEYSLDRALPIPALVVTGSLDPVTPERWGRAMAERFAPARLVVVPGGGHTVSATGCVPELLAAFVDAADPAVIDPSCLADSAAPPFFIDPFHAHGGAR